MVGVMVQTSTEDGLLGVEVQARRTSAHASPRVPHTRPWWNCSRSSGHTSSHQGSNLLVTQHKGPPKMPALASQPASAEATSPHPILGSSGSPSPFLSSPLLQECSSPASLKPGLSAAHSFSAIAPRLSIGHVLSTLPNAYACAPVPEIPPHESGRL